MSITSNRASEMEIEASLASQGVSNLSKAHCIVLQDTWQGTIGFIEITDIANKADGKGWKG